MLCQNFKYLCMKIVPTYLDMLLCFYASLDLTTDYVHSSQNLYNLPSSHAFYKFFVKCDASSDIPFISACGIE